MSLQEEMDVSQRAAEGDKEAQDKMVESNLRFVVSVAKMYSSDPFVIEELIQAGNIGLIYASKKFDPTLGFKFISFAVWHIRKEMLTHLGKNIRVVKLPISRVNLLSQVKESTSLLTMEFGRDPTKEEIIENLKEREVELARTLDVNTLTLLMNADERHSSFDVQFGDESESTLLDVIWDDTHIFDTDMFNEGREYYLNKILSQLCDRERYVIKEYYGLNEDGIPKSTFQIAKDIGISQSGLRSMILRVVRKLKITADDMGIETKDLFK